MTSVRKTAPAFKPRSIGWVVRSTPTSGVIRITIGEGPRAEKFFYYLREIPADFGRGFEVRKYDGTDIYHVNLGGGNCNSDSCDCLGNERWSRCKHVHGIRALLGIKK